MRDFIKQLFQDKNGKFSSKRVFALLSFIVGVVIAIVVKDPTLVTIFVGQATILFTSTVAER